MFGKIKNSIIESTEYKQFCSVLSSYFDWFYEKFFFGILSHFEKKFVKYLIVGFINTIISYAIYAIIVTITLRPSFSLGISYLISIFINFQTTGKIVFNNSKNSLIIKFFLSYLTTFIINRYLLDTMVFNLKMDKYLSQALLVFPVALISFAILKHFVFVEKK